MDADFLRKLISDIQQARFEDGETEGSETGMYSQNVPSTPTHPLPSLLPLHTPHLDYTTY